MMSVDIRTFKHESPMYAWECITLKIKDKNDIYLIIKNEEIMSQFIKFLIYSLHTIDGNRESMRPLSMDLFRKYKKKIYLRDNNDKDWEIDSMIKHQVMLQVFVKYRLMRVKMKISYNAHLKSYTILEIWLR